MHSRSTAPQRTAAHRSAPQRTAAHRMLLRPASASRAAQALDLAAPPVWRGQRVCCSRECAWRHPGWPHTVAPYRCRRFSIINSLMIVLFLSGMVAMIMMRTLHRDFNRYNATEAAEDVEEETGWKLVHGDVYAPARPHRPRRRPDPNALALGELCAAERHLLCSALLCSALLSCVCVCAACRSFRPPPMPMLLSVSVGTGVQTLTMSVITMAFAVLGFLSPANRGGLMTAMLLLFVFMGVPAGFSSAFLHKTLKGTEWKKNILLTSCLFIGIIFTIFFVLNFFVWGEKSSGAVPFGTLFALLVLWFGISVPLVFLGAYFGYRRKALDFPVRVNQIPRQIPEQVWYMKPAFSVVVGGVLPFGAVFIELFFILSSIWLHQFYYVFGFLMLVFVILVITCAAPRASPTPSLTQTRTQTKTKTLTLTPTLTLTLTLTRCAEITIVMCYFQLCAEDYNWWWRSFLTSGSSAGYMFAYSVFYFFTKLEITKFVSGLLYFGYMSIAALVFFVSTGTIGFYACYWFVWKIFSAIKVD
jgi:transmembrane 9 superfamily protein 2/4